MDFIQSAQTLLRRAQDLRDHVNTSGPSDTISTIAEQVVNFFLPSLSSSSTSSTLSTFQREYINPYILSPLQSLYTDTTGTNASRSSTNGGGIPDLLSLIALIVIAFISFKVLDYVRRVVMWWTMLALKVSLLLVALQVGWYVSQHGWEKTLNDAGWLWGLLEGFLGETGTRFGGSRRSRTTAAGTRERNRQQVPLRSTRGRRGGWS